MFGYNLTYFCDFVIFMVISILLVSIFIGECGVFVSASRTWLSRSALRFTPCVVDLETVEALLVKLEDSAITAGRY